MGATDLPNSDHVAVSEAPIDAAKLVALVADPSAGAVVLFLGTVRDHSPGRTAVTALEYETYGEVVEGRIRGILVEARTRHSVVCIAAVHRLGSLGVGEISVGVAVSAGHRPDAFAAARFVIDELKATAPIWKKEHWQGGAEWVGGG
ncbi:MAG: molybdenum cofactor biosynthesis protein MoaE [Actinomycetota bacterium]|mgnify:FL=1